MALQPYRSPAEPHPNPRFALEQAYEQRVADWKAVSAAVSAPPPGPTQMKCVRRNLGLINVVDDAGERR
jgi:hypothetical protein